MADKKNYCRVYHETCEWSQDSHCEQQNYCTKREQKIREDFESRDDETSELNGFENSAEQDEEDEE